MPRTPITVELTPGRGRKKNEGTWKAFIGWPVMHFIGEGSYDADEVYDSGWTNTGFQDEVFRAVETKLGRR